MIYKQKLNIYKFKRLRRTLKNTINIHNYKNMLEAHKNLIPLCILRKQKEIKFQCEGSQAREVKEMRRDEKCSYSLVLTEKLSPTQTSQAR
jgi:hypothetical protein